MRKTFILLLLCALCVVTRAQCITHTFNNVSLSDALVYLQEHSHDSHITFIYNDLEDFRVTTTIKNSTVKDAISQLIGFYPIRMVEDEVGGLYVECYQKTQLRYKGRILDESGQPAAYANIALLSTCDSSFITGGVSNESGYFVIPCEVPEVIAKVSYVGYKTVRRHCTNPSIGTIRLSPDKYTLKGVTVKSLRPQYKMAHGGMTVDIEHSLLSKVGSAKDVLAQLPRVNVATDGSVSVFAKGTPEIYINNRLVRDNDELKQLKSDDIKQVYVITSPGAQYNASVKSVIRIKTLRKQGDGLSLRTESNVSNNGRWNGSEELYLTYRKRGLELFGNGSWSTEFLGGDNELKQVMSIGDHTKTILSSVNSRFRSGEWLGKLGFNLDLNDNHSLGAYYSAMTTICGRGHTVGAYDDVWQDGIHQGTIDQSLNLHIFFGPVHSVNAYYLGKVGKLSFDFDGSYLWKKDGRDDDWVETSETFEDRLVHTHNLRHSRLWAGKLMVGYPLGKGQLQVGSEMSHSISQSTYTNPEHYIDDSNNDITENNVAAFAEYSLTLGNWSIHGGLRYEHVNTIYKSFGVKEDEPSRTYNDWFPNLSLSWNKGLWGVELSASRKIKRPSYTSLCSNVQYDGRFMSEGGNPYLQPTIIHNVELNANYSWLSMSIGYYYDKNEIIWSNKLNSETESGFTQNRNYPHWQYVYASVVASPKFGWYQPSWEVEFTKEFFNTCKYGCSRDLQDPSATIRLNNRFVLNKQSFFFVNYRYSTEACEGFQKTKASSSVNLLFSYSLLHDTLQFNVYANDLFKGNLERWTMYGDGVEETKHCYNYSRSIGLTVTYKFNTSKSHYKGTGAGNDEKSRM